MAVQRTFSILKPDVTRRNLTGADNQRIEAAGLRIVAQKRVHMTRAQAETFYGVHRERPFFGELVEMMTAARAAQPSGDLQGDWVEVLLACQVADDAVRPGDFVRHKLQALPPARDEGDCLTAAAELADQRQA